MNARSPGQQERYLALRSFVPRGIEHSCDV